MEDESKSCITYVEALQFNQVYMVLTYFTDARAEPLVLDNLISAIGPGLVRHGLQLIGSFTVCGLCWAKVKGGSRLIGDADQLKPWGDLKRWMIIEAL